MHNKRVSMREGEREKERDKVSSNRIDFHKVTVVTKIIIQKRSGWSYDNRGSSLELSTSESNS